MNQVQNISFHGQTVPVFTRNQTHYVAMKPIVENIGLDWVSQHKKIQRSEILNSTMVMMTIVAEDGKKREMLCLPLDYLNGWLFGVDAKRVKPEIRERLLTYQRECFRALNNHFNQPKQAIKLPAPANADILATRAEMHSILNALQAASTSSFVDTYGSWDAKIRGMVGNRLHDLDFYQLSSLIQKLIKDLPKYILEKHPEILRRIKEERYDLNRPSEKPLDAKPKTDLSDRDEILIELAGRPIVAGVNCPVEPFGLGASRSKQAESLPAMLAAEEKKQLPAPVVVKAADSSNTQCRKREIAENHNSAIARLLTYDGDTSTIQLAECAAANEIINLAKIVSDAHENFMFCKENQNQTDDNFKCAMLELTRLQNTIMELICC